MESGWLCSYRRCWSDPVAAAEEEEGIEENGEAAETVGTLKAKGGDSGGVLFSSW